MRVTTISGTSAQLVLHFGLITILLSWWVCTAWMLPYRNYIWWCKEQADKKIHDRLSQQLTLTIAKLANVFSTNAAENILGVSRLGEICTRKLCICGLCVAIAGDLSLRKVTNWEPFAAITIDFLVLKESANQNGEWVRLTSATAKRQYFCV